MAYAGHFRVADGRHYAGCADWRVLLLSDYSSGGVADGDPDGQGIISFPIGVVHGASACLGSGLLAMLSNSAANACRASRSARRIVQIDRRLVCPAVCPSTGESLMDELSLPGVRLVIISTFSITLVRCTAMVPLPS